jgi:polysaccharide biosynthesis protein PslG
VNAPGFFGYGIQADPSGNAPNDIGKIKGMGFGWVKFQMPWQDVQPSPGSYNWWDDRINQYAGNGVQILLSIPKAPRWARTPGNYPGNGPPAEDKIGAYADFLAQVATRYRGKVQAIEVYNEQNIAAEWSGGQEPYDPARYVRMLCASYRAIKAANPDMIVVSGALTPTGANPPAASGRDLDYLRGMYANGLKNCSDAIGAHPSGFANSPDLYCTFPCNIDPNRGYDDDPSFFFRNTLEDFRNIMVANGDGGKRIWPTEFGWGIYRFKDPSYIYMQSTSPEQQAAWTVAAFQKGKSYGWVGVMFLWNLDYGLTCDCENANFGILTKQGDSPAYGALAAMPK